MMTVLSQFFSNLFSHRTLFKHKPPLWWLMFGTMFWIFGIYIAGRIVTGPFIFNDEFDYFSFARTLFYRNNINTFTQYGPLYPLLISPFFTLKSLVLSYRLIRVFNILICASAILPAYLLAKDLFADKYLRRLLPWCVLITPFSSFVYLVWAEPLYIALFYWTCYAFFQFLKQAKVLNSVMLGLMLASLYYTKPGAGLVMQCAALLTLLTSLYRCEKRYFFYCLLVICVFLLVDLPWALHYRYLGQSIFGYPQSNYELAFHVEQLGYLRVFWNGICSAFYQFSYIVIGSWGFIAVFIPILVMSWSRLLMCERYFSLFIVLAVLGLITLSALGMSTNRVLDYRMPNGRYLSLFFPLIVVLTLHLFLKMKAFTQKKWLLITAMIGLALLITTMASPFYTLNPIAYTSMPELSILIFIMNKGLIHWGPMIQLPAMWLRVFTPMYVGGVVFLSLLYIKQTQKTLAVSLFIFLAFLLSSLASHYYVIKMGHGQSPFNNVYTHFLKWHLDKKNIVFDKKLASGNTQSMALFWFNAAPIFFTLDEWLEKKDFTKIYFVSMGKLKEPTLFSTQVVSIYKLKRK